MAVHGVRVSVQVDSLTKHFWSQSGHNLRYLGFRFLAVSGLVDFVEIVLINLYGVVLLDTAFHCLHVIVVTVAIDIGSRIYNNEYYEKYIKSIREIREKTMFLPSTV